MNIRRKYRIFLICVLAFSLAILGGMLYIKETQDALPDEISVFSDEISEYLDENNAFSGKVSVLSNEVLSEEASDGVLVAAFKNVRNETDNVTESYEADYRLFGVFPVKTVTVNVVERQVVIPCGIPAGIYVETDGVLVVDTVEVTMSDGSKTSPAESILKAGDYITSVNGETISRKSELTEAVAACGGEEVILGIRRNEEEFQVRITPAEVSAGEYMLGVWVRDNTQGIGMITYLTTDGRFGAIGHGISDIDTGTLLESTRGLLYNTCILSVVKGAAGSPGELVGYIDYDADNVIGRVDKNSSTGIFGEIDEAFYDEVTAEPVQICLKQDIETGPATILTSIDGEVEEYEVEILSVNVGENDENKGIVLQVTDERLLEATGGIVQGMSGSPILQNGKIIGAVTHVFVKDATKGFGIFIENMLEADGEG